MSATMTVTLRTSQASGIATTVPTTRLALGYHAFARLTREHFGAETPTELHIDTSAPDAAELDALDDELRDRAVTVADLASAGRGFVLLTGEGVDGCDVWALCDIPADAD
jgi:hypothetical protein